MKRNILARRAASAALAACMMFSLSAPALAASTDALLQQSTAAKSAVSVLDEENGTEVETEYQMNLKYGSIRVYIGDDGKQYVQQGENAPQQRGNLQITTDGGRTTNTLTIEGAPLVQKSHCLMSISRLLPMRQSRSAAMWSWSLKARISCKAARTTPVWKRPTTTGP